MSHDLHTCTIKLFVAIQSQIVVTNESYYDVKILSHFQSHVMLNVRILNDGPGISLLFFLQWKVLILSVD